MPTKPIKQFTAWSYSRLIAWEDCPLFAKLKFLDKEDVGVAGPALLRGSAIHEDAENYVKGVTKGLPSSLKLFAEEFKELRKNRKYVKVEDEAQVCFTDKWQLTSWFGHDAWCRIKVDVLDSSGETMRRIIDHKTGKINPTHKDQLSLCAIGAFADAPSCVKTVSAENWYLDQGEIREGVFKRSEVPKLKKEWEKRVAPMMRAKSFKPKPGNACRWCPFRKDKGGQCKY